MIQPRAATEGRPYSTFHRSVKHLVATGAEVRTVGAALRGRPWLAPAPYHPGIC